MSTTELQGNLSQKTQEQPSLDWFISKKYFFALTLIAPLLPTISAYIAINTRQGLWLSLTAFFNFVLVPMLDAAFGRDTYNPTESQQAVLKKERFYVWILYVATLCHWVALIATTYAVTTMDLSVLHYLGAVLSIGAMHSVVIAMSHELGHRTNDRFQVWAAKISIASCGYGHFNIEHNRGHHKHVSTPEDHASARMGENLYKFAYRELPGVFFRAWSLEKERLEKKGEKAWSFKNEILHSWILTIVGFSAMTYAFGIVALPFLIITSAYGWFQLSMANYIEHYGLLRQKLDDGRYERCQPKHSWNSNFCVSNLISLHLQRHSDHHAHPTRPYQLLRDFPEAPQMPMGYPSMMMLSTIPPLWYKLMDKKVVEWANGDLNLVNMDEKAKSSLFARYHKAN